MSNLTVETPSLKFEEATSGVAILEKPVTIATGEVRNSVGQVLSPQSFKTTGFLTYRTRMTGAENEVWNESAKLWQSVSSVDIDTLPITAMIYNDGESLPWRGLLVAAGTQDTAGFDKFDPATSGYPRYFFRARFVTNDESTPQIGLSAPSDNVSFVDLTDAMRAGLRLEQDKSPTNTNEIELFLRNSSLQTVGRVNATIVGGSARIEIANLNSGGDQICAVILQPNGTIEIAPGASAALKVNGNLEVTGDLRVAQVLTVSGNSILEKVEYRSQSTNLRRWLT
jgi:hypothetical protein